MAPTVRAGSSTTCGSRSDRLGNHQPNICSNGVSASGREVRWRFVVLHHLRSVHLAPGHTGIDFVHQWTPRDAYESRLLRTGFAGGGVCPGDYDGDKQCDACLTRPHGGGRFDLTVANMAGISHYRKKMAMGAMESVAWFLDYAQPRQYMRNAVYLNTGTERFLEGAFLLGLAKSNWIWSLKVNDLDGDGVEDIYVTNGFTRDYMDSDFSRSLASRGLKGSPDAWLKAPELKERNLAFSRGKNERYKDNASRLGAGRRRHRLRR